MRAFLIDPFTAPFMTRALAELALLALMCGPVSVFIFVRRLSFVADALTHTVFPGVVIGYLTGGLEGIFGGALVAGLVTAIALSLLTRHGQLSEDAAIAVMLTAMFSIGVILVSRQSSYTSDLTSFLFGRVLTVSRPQLLQTGLLAIVVLGLLAVTARVLIFRAFDPIGATAAGYRIGWLDAWLNVIVALVVVAAVRAVGTVLVVALLLVPAATARLLTDRLLAMAVIGAGVTMGAGYLGLLASWTASIDYGLRLTSASAVVLALVAAYLLALPVGALRGRRARRRKAAINGTTPAATPAAGPAPTGWVSR